MQLLDKQREPQERPRGGAGVGIADPFFVSAGGGGDGGGESIGVLVPPSPQPRAAVQYAQLNLVLFSDQFSLPVLSENGCHTLAMVMLMECCKRVRVLCQVNAMTIPPENYGQIFADGKGKHPELEELSLSVLWTATRLHDRILRKKKNKAPNPESQPSQPARSAYEAADLQKSPGAVHIGDIRNAFVVGDEATKAGAPRIFGCVDLARAMALASAVPWTLSEIEKQREAMLSSGTMTASGTALRWHLKAAVNMALLSENGFCGQAWVRNGTTWSVMVFFDPSHKGLWYTAVGDSHGVLMAKRTGMVIDWEPWPTQETSAPMPESLFERTRIRLGTLLGLVEKDGADRVVKAEDVNKDTGHDVVTIDVHYVVSAKSLSAIDRLQMDTDPAENPSAKTAQEEEAEAAMDVTDIPDEEQEDDADDPIAVLDADGAWEVVQSSTQTQQQDRWSEV